MKKIAILILNLLLVLNIQGCAFEPEISALDEIKDGQEKAAPIIEALTKYYDDFGEYPTNLNELSPSYLLEIPQTLSRRNFTFEVDEHDIYHLSFPVESNKDVGSGTICTYLRKLEAWDCSQSFE